MLQQRIKTVSPRARKMVNSFRAQLVFLLLCACVAPAALFYIVRDQNWMGAPQLDNSMVAAALAITAAVVVMRKVTAFPGTNAFSFILPSYGAAYAIATAIFLGLRLDYSGAYLTTSFVCAIVAAFYSSHWLRRVELRRFFIVPAGDIAPLLRIDNVEWIVLEEPAVPEQRDAVIVADLRHDHPDAWERMLAEAALAGRPVYHTKQLGESLTGKVSIEHLSENSFGSLLPNLAYLKAKRLIDVVACLILLPLLAIPMGVVALLIRRDSPGPALFRQQRMGHRGVPFEVIKFRSMRMSSEMVAADARNLHDEARITRFGRLMRRSRIDELPQLFNVLMGHMSLIGPRPEAIPLSDWYQAELPFYVYRHIVRPGITGWAQVNQGHVADLESVNTKLQYDFYYIKNFSAWLDLLITFRTLWIMASGFGSK